MKLAREIKLPVIASGGLSSIADIEKLAQHESDGIIGAIAGRAIYEGTLELQGSAQSRAEAARGPRCRSPSASFPASTSPTAGSSRASTSSTCAMPAIRSRSRAATTSRAPTSSRSSTSAPASRSAALLYDMIEAVASQVFIPLTVGGGVNAVDDIRALLNAGADKVSINTSGVQNPELIGEASGALRRAMHRRPRSTPRNTRSTRGRSTSTAAARPRASTPCEWAQDVGGARRGRDPAHQHGPRRRAHGVRPARSRARSPTPSTCR